MKRIRRIFIFRHGETDWNAEGRFQGHTDIPLNDKGRAQAAELIPQLRPTGIQAILSSDLSRARETAQIVASALHVPVFADHGLREANLGDAQGLTWQEIEKKFPHVHLRWRSSLPSDGDVSYPGGESGKHVVERSFGAMERFFTEHPHYERIGVSAHGGVIRRVMQQILPPESEPVKIPNCVLYEIRFDGEKWELAGNRPEPWPATRSAKK